MSETSVTTDRVYARNAGQVKGYVQSKVPSNLSILNSGGSFTFFTMGLNATGILNQDAKKFAEQLTYTDSRRLAGTTMFCEAYVLERESGSLDLAVKVKAVFTPGYEEDTLAERRSQYQDEVSFSITPRDSAHIDIDHRSVVPMTAINTVNYSNAVTWSAQVGFQAGKEGSGSAGAGFATEASASVDKSDFGIERQTNPQLNRLTWRSAMRNVYNGEQADPGGYASPSSMIVSGAFTTWLRNPAAAARADLDLEFVATYNLKGHDVRSKRIILDLQAEQRLMHAESVGRWGASTARVAGVGIVVPSLVEVKGEIVIDLSTRTITIARTSQLAYTMKEMIDARREGVTR